MEVYACYGNKTILNCENWGREDINISVNDSRYNLQGGRKLINHTVISEGVETITRIELRNQNVESTQKSFSSEGVANITIFTNDLNYTLDLTRAVQSNQFYLVFKQNSTEGTYIA
jgi:hypothetical protein